MATTSNKWMPLKGRHEVLLGSSLRRALKARKGTAAPNKKAGPPDRDFYSLRYNFKPESVDSVKPGTIEVKRGKDATTVTVERSSSQGGEMHVFTGQEQAAKDWECVLIYDEELGTFTLEKLDSFVNLNHGRRPTTLNNPSPLPSTSTPKDSPQDVEMDAASHEDDAGIADADGEIDDMLEEIIPTNIARREEEEEGEEEEIPIRSIPQPVPKASSQRPTKPASKPDVALTRPQRPPANKGKGKAKREASDIETEEFDFGGPAQPKRSKPSPPPAPTLALPGGSPTNTFRPPPTWPRQPAHVPSPPPPADSEDEEDWDEVSALPAPVPTPAKADNSEDEDGEEIDLNDFEAQMDAELQEESDGSVGSPEPVSGGPSGRPMSLNQLAGGESNEDEDDFSTSDESEED